MGQNLFGVMKLSIFIVTRVTKVLVVAIQDALAVVWGRIDYRFLGGKSLFSDLQRIESKTVGKYGYLAY